MNSSKSMPSFPFFSFVSKKKSRGYNFLDIRWFYLICNMSHFIVFLAIKIKFYDHIFVKNLTYNYHYFNLFALFFSHVKSISSCFETIDKGLRVYFQEIFRFLGRFFYKKFFNWIRGSFFVVRKLLFLTLTCFPKMEIVTVLFFKLITFFFPYKLISTFLFIVRCLKLQSNAETKGEKPKDLLKKTIIIKERHSPTFDQLPLIALNCVIAGLSLETLAQVSSMHLTPAF